MNRSTLLFTRLFIYLLFISTFTGLQSFKKSSPGVISPLASSYSSDVLNKWMAMQIKLMSTTIANFNGPFVRVYAYTGLATYASILPGIQKKFFSAFFSNSIE